MDFGGRVEKVALEGPLGPHIPDLIGPGLIQPQHPHGDADRVVPEIGGLPAGIVAHKAEAVEAAVLVVRGLGCGSQPHVVLEPLRHRHRLPAGTRPLKVVFGDIGDHAARRADHTLAHGLAKAREEGGRAPLTAGLQHALVHAHGLQHLLAVAHGQPQRLLAIDVFARRRSLDRLDGMPVVRRDDGHRIDVAARQQLAEIGIDGAPLERSGGGASGIGLLHAVAHRFAAEKLLVVLVPVTGPVDVADRHDLHIRHRQPLFEILLGLIAAADDAEGDAFGRRIHAQRLRAHDLRPQRDAGCGRLQKIAARASLDRFLVVRIHVRAPCAPGDQYARPMFPSGRHESANGMG